MPGYTALVDGQKITRKIKPRYKYAGNETVPVPGPEMKYAVVALAARDYHGTYGRLIKQGQWTALYWAPTLELAAYYKTVDERRREELISRGYNHHIAEIRVVPCQPSGGRK